MVPLFPASEYFCGEYEAVQIPTSLSLSLPQAINFLWLDANRILFLSLKLRKFLGYISL
jgi:hypothetical protein